MSKAFLVGCEPESLVGYTFVKEPPYDAVVIGSLSISQLLCFSQENVLTALAEGKPVLLYTPGLPKVTGNRALAASLTARQRELKSWGVVFTDGCQKKLITAQAARQLLSQGRLPQPGAVLTPLAKEILERE